MTPEQLKQMLEALRNGDAQKAHEAAGCALPLEAPALASRLYEPDEHTLHPAPSETPAPATDDAIATFLDTYGHGSSPEEDALIERLIFNPQPDYAAYLEQQEPAPATPSAETDDPQLDAINRFLATPPGRLVLDPADEPAAVAAAPAAPEKITVAAPPDPNVSLGESMARLLITQGQYAKAREALIKLNLENSRKKRYFALQISYLDRLIANQARLDAESNQSTPET